MSKAEEQHRGVVGGRLRDKSNDLYYWQEINSEKDLPENDTWNEYPEKHIVKVPHDDGRGGYHVVEMDFDDLQESWNSIDGRLKYLKSL